MDEANGSYHGGPKAMNGINGSAKSSLNGHAVLPRRRKTTRKGSGFLTKSFGIAARVATWYSIVTILFRCPATLEQCTEASPSVCRPYFQVKQAVSPTVAPYYEAYAAPYVELLQGYYDTLDHVVISPTWAYALKHGAPRVTQAQSYGQAQWEKNVRPQLAKYQDLAMEQYDQNLAPYVLRASDTLAPYLDIARTNALQTYHELLLPSYQSVQPYALRGYFLASTYATGTALPAVMWAWDSSYGFVKSAVWPQLRIVYVDAVEPQLVKIGERLGRYNGRAPISADSDPAILAKTPTGSLFVKPTSSASAMNRSSPSSINTAESNGEAATPSGIPDNSIVDQAATDSSASVEPKPVLEDDAEAAMDDTRRAAKEVVAEDLKSWQDRYAKAADEGAAEIEERVLEISQRMIAEQAQATGKSMVADLQHTVDLGLDRLKADVQAVVAKATAQTTTAEESRADLATAVRRVGLEIKEKAQGVRKWRETYEKELHHSITQAAETHFRILDGIRDLALQKIGMKWAWTDGVTYQDWAKYHQLKGRFDEWQGDLERLIVTHPSLEEAQIEGNAVEIEAMEIASIAAKELARLKQVGLWKLDAGDASDEFDSDATRAAAEAAVSIASPVTHLAEETASTESQEAVDPASEGASRAASSVFEPVDEATAAPTVMVEETVLPPIGSMASEASAAASSGISQASSFLSSNVRQGASKSQPDLASQASSAILAETPIIAGDTGELTEPDGPPPVELPFGDSLEREVPDLPLSSSSTTSSVKPVFMGAAAQAVPSRKPILDNDDDNADAIEYLRSDLPSSISAVASSAYSQAISQAGERYSQALSIVSAQMKGTTTQAVHEQMLASVTSAYSQAIASASSRLDSAVKSAQDRFAGTPVGTSVLPSIPTFDWSRIEAIAAERLEQGRTWAEEQYTSAKIAIGLATPTPSTPAEHVDRLLQNAKFNYYAGLGVAQARYSEFLAAASSAVSSLTATPTPTDIAGTASSVASVASESVASVASVASESAASVASVASDSVSSAASAITENLSSAAQVGYDTVAGAGLAAQENWDAAVSRLSMQIYGAPTPTPWYQSLYDAAGGYAASATEAAASGAGSVTSAANTYASSAAEEAAKQYAAVSVIVSELVLGKEPSFSESVFSRLSAAYVTGVKSAESVASAVSKTVVSAANEATEAVKESVQRAKDEL